VIDFQYNYPLIGTEAALIGAALRKHIGESTAWVSERPFAGTPEQRKVAASFLSEGGFDVEPSCTFLCSGAHCALSVILTKVFLDGSAIATDELTYPNFRLMATDRGIKLIACASDEDGMLPQALAEAATRQGVKAVFLMPTVHNPLGTVMPIDRRLALADIIRQHRLLLIEDDAYRFLEPDAPTPISFLVPELGCFIFSLSKPVAPGVKLAYLVVPESLSDGMEEVIALTNSGTSILFATVLTSLILDGTVARLIADKQALGRKMQALISSSLDALTIRAHRNSFHSWVRLPHGIDAEGFCGACKSKGVLVSSGVRYRTLGALAHDSHQFFRIAVGSERNCERITEGLATVRLVASMTQPTV
jgi:DNA-binding transcriptional MocR family regulator